MDHSLFGKKALFVGDSIALALRDIPDEQGLQGWAKYAAKEFHMDCTNAAIGGAALNSRTRLRRFGNQGVIANQIKKHEGEAFDCVLIHGGLNDAWDGVPLGKITDSFDPADFDPTTYAGGLETAFYQTVKYFGKGVLIGYIINFNSPNHSATSGAEEYYEWGKKVCAKWGIEYLDLFHRPFDTAIYTQDTLHPNAEGYGVLGRYVCDFLPEIHPIPAEIAEKITV